MAVTQHTTSFELREKLEEGIQSEMQLFGGGGKSDRDAGVAWHNTETSARRLINH